MFLSGWVKVISQKQKYFKVWIKVSFNYASFIGVSAVLNLWGFAACRLFQENRVDEIWISNLKYKEKQFFQLLCLSHSLPFMEKPS